MSQNHTTERMQPISVPSAPNPRVISPRPQPTTMNLGNDKICSCVGVCVCTHLCKNAFTYIYRTNLYSYDQLDYKVLHKYVLFKSQKVGLFLHLADAKSPSGFKALRSSASIGFYRNTSRPWSAQCASYLKAYLKGLGKEKQTCQSPPLCKET